MSWQEIRGQTQWLVSLISTEDLPKLILNSPLSSCQAGRDIFLHSKFDSFHIWGQTNAEGAPHIGCFQHILLKTLISNVGSFESYNLDHPPLLRPQDGHCSILSGGVIIHWGRYPSHHLPNQIFTANLGGRQILRSRYVRHGIMTHEFQFGLY